MRHILYILICLAMATTALGKGADTVKRIATSEGTVAGKGITLSGIIVSDYASANMATNPNINYNIVDVTASVRTAYIVDEQGRNGICLEFDNIYDNHLRRNTAVEVSLQGCTIYKYDNPTRYIIKGVASENISVTKENVAPPQRIMRYAELQDEDIYTFVTLRDVEFVEKNGSLLNIYEPFALASPINRKCSPNGYMDGWATLLKDGDGSAVYMFLNTLCPWRRDGSGVPQGKGSVSGIVVAGEMLRYGGRVAKYAIRPIERTDIAFDGAERSQYATIAEWNWDKNSEAALDYEFHGRLTGETDSHIMGDRVRADVGNGFLWSDVLAYTRTDEDYNAATAEKNGVRKYGGFRFESNLHDWYRFDESHNVIGTNGVYVECSTAEATTGFLTLDFSVVAGNHSANHSWGYPAWWTVAYSTDGTTFREIEGSRFRLPAIAYKEANIKRVGKRQTACDAALGLTEHCVRLPQEALGREHIVLRIAPAEASFVDLPENPMEVRTDKSLPYEMLHFFVLKFGKITIQHKTTN